MNIHDHAVRIIALAALFVALLLLPSFTRADLPSPGAENRSSPAMVSSASQILDADDSGIVFELTTPPLAFAADGSVLVNGLEEAIVDQGSPALPYYSIFVALPPDATAAVTVAESDLTVHSLVNVLPVPKVQLWGEEAGDGDILVFAPGSVKEQAPESTQKRSVYRNDAAFPGASYQLSDPLYLRDMRMVELKLFPLQYKPLQKTLTQASRMVVNLRFNDSNLDDLRPAPGYVDSQEVAWRDSVINYDQARAWRSLPQSLSEPSAVELPIGISTYKIEVDQDGIYEVSGSDLAALGMSLPVVPSTIQMMHDGHSVAYQFIDVNDNQQFDELDLLRFYGWAFDGTRQEKLYVAKNVFWLWAGGSASQIPALNNQAGSGSKVSSFPESITKQEELIFFSNWAIKWNESPNNPTNWHWYHVKAGAGSTGSYSFDIDLPNPDPTGDSTYLVELTTRLYPTVGQFVPTYLAQTFINNAASHGEGSWSGHQNLNISNQVSGSTLKLPNQPGYPSNQVQVDFSGNAAVTSEAYVTRITVDYTRQLVALNDQLLFGRKASGQSDFEVSGFTNGSANNILVWDISDRYLPKQIVMQAGNVTGGGSDHTYHIGRNHGPDADFIATTSENILKVKPVSKYIPVPIDPPTGKAEWLAISHSSLRSAADDLAAYRHPQMGAWVVNIEDVVNQIGFGLHTPDTIREYLQHAMSNWTTAPNYVTIFGDATNNPRNLDCAACNSWDKNKPTLVITDFYHLDRFQGMIPSDFSMSLLSGDDLIPDIAISRVAANSLQEADNMVQKVIRYETQRQGTVQEWQKNFLFVADNRDAGGDFCSENAQIGSQLPDNYRQTHLCLPAPTQTDTNELRVAMAKHINDIGVSVMNYRGHGSVTHWAASSQVPDGILSTDDTDFWQNSGRSVVILSADCLDGYFIRSGVPALGETFMGLNNRGSAAHWSSAGLGYSSEHTVLHSGFYEGVFDRNLVSVGDAANFAKIKYYQSGRYISEVYGFILLGDAAMEAVPYDPPTLFLPVVSAPQ